jgi:F-box interacting protein
MTKLLFKSLPDDVVFDILTMLPVKSLIRFRCVSKFCNSTITSPIFFTKHLNLNKAKSLPNHNGYLLYTSHAITSDPDRELCAVVCNSDFTLTEISRFKIPFVYNMFGFCNGMFGFFKHIDYTIYLWNPTIKKSKILAAAGTTCSCFPTSFCSFTHGLAYDSQNNDYKILRIVSSNEWIGSKIVQEVEAEVYTLSTDSWRRVVISVGSLSGSILRTQENPCVFVNGALHSIAYTLEKNFILCFDVNDERFREIMLPDDYLDGFSPIFYCSEQLVVFKGSLALVDFGRIRDEESYICRIWVMGEYGVVNSWTKKIVPLETKYATGLVSLDPESLNEQNLGTKNPAKANFLESLVLLDGVNV